MSVDSQALGQLHLEEPAATLSTSAGGHVTEAGMPKKHRIKMVSGDDTRDGHGKSTEFTIMSNLDARGLESAFRTGVKMLDFDVQDWSNFRASSGNVLPQEACKKFEEHGFDFSRFDTEEADGSDDSADDGGSKVFVDCYQKDLPTLWLFTAKLGAPQLEYEYASGGDIIKIGGWSLFECD